MHACTISNRIQLFKKYFQPSKNNMNTPKHLVTIVVPIYKPTLSEYEEISFKQLFKVLGNHRIVIFKPISLDLSNLLSNYPPCKTESFSDHYFKGIAGYNRLMMAEEFYSRFNDSEYILIYQLDAYTFKDELIDWCMKGYDYIGAPWLLRPIYNFPLLKFTSWIKRKYCQITNQPCSQMTRFKVGNGGLSLRKISSHIKAVTELKTITEQYLQVRHHLYNEDVFFSIEVNRHGLNFRYPSWQEALQFSFDKYPSLCYKYNNEQLPFGCHSWYKRRMKKFWFPIILGK